MVFEGNAGTMNVSVCVRLDSSLRLDRNVNLLLNTHAGTASKPSKLCTIMCNCACIIYSENLLINVATHHWGTGHS